MEINKVKLDPIGVWLAKWIICPLIVLVLLVMAFNLTTQKHKCQKMAEKRGFVESMYEGLRESMIRSQLGHLQIYKKGYSEFGSIDPEQYLLSKNTVARKLFLHAVFGKLSERNIEHRTKPFTRRCRCHAPCKGSGRANCQQLMGYVRCTGKT